jgi:hypothetical protein
MMFHLQSSYNAEKGTFLFYNQIHGNSRTQYTQVLFSASNLALETGEKNFRKYSRLRSLQVLVNVG